MLSALSAPRDADDNHALKRRLVAEDRAHAAVVLDGDEVVVEHEPDPRIDAAVQAIEARMHGELRVKPLQEHAADLDLYGTGR